MLMRRSSFLAASAMLIALLLLAAPSSTTASLTWEQVLADNSDSSAAKASSSSAAAPAHAKSSPSSSVPAVSLALANFWATLTWNDGQWDCVPSAQPGSVGTARCTVYPAMIALVISCPDGKQAIAPSCFHPFIGDSPNTVYGWFVRDDKTACGFTNPPEQQENPFVIGGSGYCMSVADVVPAKKSSKGAKHGR
jgi:hypothetical protein